MAATLKLDIPGSQETRGISHSRYDRAIRRGQYYETTLLDPVDLKQAALEQFKTDAGLLHNNNTTMPLARVNMRLRGRYRVMLSGEYFRTFQNIPSGGSAFSFATFSTTIRATHWYSRPYTLGAGNALVQAFALDGTPNGMLEFENATPIDGISDPRARPKYWIWRQRGWQITVNALLNFNPAGLVAARQDTLNSGTAMFGGYDFPAGTVRFDGAHIQWIETNAGDRFSVRYQFSAFKEGFKIQACLFDQPVGPPAWVAVNGEEYPRVNWGSGFPV